MKKILFTFAVSGAFLFAAAQPSFDFESWTTMNNGSFPVPQEPTGWITENQLVNSLVSPGNDTSVFQVTGSEAHSGLYAMKIKTVTINNDPTGGQLPNPSGGAYTGKVQISPLKLIGGFSYVGRPASCSFWYKYSPQGGDSAACSIILTKWNTSTSTRDTLAVGGVVMKNAVSTYTQASFNLTYDTTYAALTSDTMLLSVIATCWNSMNCGTVGSMLWVDDISFAGWNGIQEYLSSEGVFLFPNPANQFVNISVSKEDAMKVVVYDAIGRMITSVPLSESANSVNKKAGIISTSNFTTGLYAYTIVDKNGKPLRAGKFNVVR